MLPLQIEIKVDNKQIEQVCQEYWDCNEKGEFRLTVAQIARNHGLKSADVSSIAYDGCDAYSDDYVCSRCEEPLIFSYRTDYLQAFRHPTRAGMCAPCQREELAALKAKQEAEKQLQLDSIKKSYPVYNFREPDIHLLSLEDAVYLLSFVRAMATEDLTNYSSAQGTTFRLAPTIDLQSEILKHLYQHKEHLIQVHPNSLIDAFTFQDGQSSSFYTHRVRWTLATGNDTEETRRFILRVENTLKNPELRPFVWNDQKLSLWRKVAFHECMEYLEVTLNEHQFQFNAGEKTYMVMSSLLDSHSVSEVYNLIWGAVRNAAAFYQRGQVSRPHAANTVIGNMQSHSERAKAEGWTIKGYKRDRRCPQSVVSQVLFNVALKIGDAGFDGVPSSLATQSGVDSRDSEESANEQD